MSNVLSVNVLIGLGVNTAIGWARADPIVALGVAVIAGAAGPDAWSDARKTARDPRTAQLGDLSGSPILGDRCSARAPQS